MNMHQFSIQSTNSAPDGSGRLLQRKCACGGTKGPTGVCAECRRKQLQRRPATRQPASATVPPIVQSVIGRTGRPLDAATRTSMESRFGHDFSQVRVHTDERAAASARAVQARAYTVGSSVVFDAGQYAPASEAGRRLLAHELTHVVQQTQSAGNVRSEAADESEADAVAARILSNAGSAPAIGSSAPALRRDNGSEYGPEREEEQRASRAELACDIAALCRLKREAPTVVTDSRVRALVRTCRPTLASVTDPCLSIAILPPSQLPGGARPGRTTTPARPAPASGGGLPDIGELTTFRFSLGDAAFTVELPSSVKARLPVELRGAGRITFDMNATTSGAFTFSITLDGIPHVRIRASATADVGAERASGALTISTMRTTCQAQDPVSARRALESAGGDLRTAISNLQRLPAPEPGEEPPMTVERLADVASGIADVYSAVNRAKERCRQVPVLTFGIEARGPLGAESDQPGFLGATATVHF